MNYLEVKNIPKVDYSFNLAADMMRRLDMFTAYPEQSRTEKIVYLARLVMAVKPDFSSLEVTKELLEPKRRWQRSGNRMPEDVVDLIREIAAYHKISFIASLDLIIITGLKFSKEYSLEVQLVRTK